ncbi:MAG: nitrous oxide reductase family maturation protein NosD [Bacteroidetes bacterium]|nr:nitrous oxide reductase family maturation protein NosD [Bacteroidota bacterium]
MLIRIQTYCLLLFLVGCILPVSAKIIVVCPTCQLATIKSGIANAEDGDEVLVKKGTYYEQKILVNKSIKLIGEDWPIVDGQDKDAIFFIESDGVELRGFQIQNVGISYLEELSGIRVVKAKNFIISGNKFFNTFFAIYLQNASNGEIIDNEIRGNAKEEMSSGNALHLWYCKKIKVDGNYFSGHRDGIYFEFADSSSVTNNLSENNLRYGLHYMFSNDDYYRNNTFRHNGAGVAVMFSRRIEMSDNLFEKNWGSASYGLLLKEIYDAEIYDNQFIQNTIGIFIEGSNRINYHNNNLSGNGWAIKMAGGCMENNFHQNNFLSNTFDLSVQTLGYDNKYDGNYWSEYTGYDLDHNGVGDVPYRPVKLYSYIVNRTPEALVLLRSIFIDILNFSEKVSPAFTPTSVLDNHPLMMKIQ